MKQRAVDLTEILLPDNGLPEMVAVSPVWRRQDFNRSVMALSAELRQRQYRAAALWFDDAARFACALLAAWHADVRAILLPNTAKDNIAWAEAEADVWLCDTVPLSDSLPVLAADTWRHLPDNPNPPQRLPADAEVWLKTSGSSGTAQIVRKTVGQMTAEARALAQVLPEWGSGCVALGSVSPQHLYGLTFRMAVSLCMGWAIGRSQLVYPEYLLDTAAQHPKTVWITSPALLKRLGAAHDWAQYRPHVAGMISAGGALAAEVSDELAGCAVRPFEIYGSTETGVVASRCGSGLWHTLPEVRAGSDERGTLWAESPWSGGRVQTADLADFAAAGFTLNGRFDRIVKLEDKRISLTDLEGCLNRHAWVSDAHCGLHPQHGRVAAWVALNAEGIACLRDHGRVAVTAELKQALAAAQDKVALPRFWRFAARLPRNPQSKITAADFQAACTASATQPDWLPESAAFADGQYRIDAQVPLDLAYFTGHFRRFPLVPGVVELQWVADYARRFDWGRQRIVRVENLKYQQFLRPNDRFTLMLDYDTAKNKSTFRLINGSTVYASGRMVFEASDSMKGGA